MYDSIAWHSTSKPVYFATSVGTVRMLSGSTMPSVGRMNRWPIPVLLFVSESSNIAIPVVSLPVPAVVGIAMKQRQTLEMTYAYD